MLLVAIVLVVVFGSLFASYFVPMFRESRQTARQAEMIREIFAEPMPPPPSPAPPPVQDTEEEPEEIEEEEVEPPPTLVQLAREATGNDHIVAFLEIPGTVIAYAVTHYYDNVFYLYHDLQGQRTSAGTVFLDYLNSPDFSDRSSILYGHNMMNGTKFHNLRFFRDPEFIEEHRQINITSAYEVLRYDVFAVFITHISFNYIQVDFFDDDDFLRLANEIKSRSEQDFEIDEFVGDDRIIILSTCWGPVGTNYRLVVAGRLQVDREDDVLEMG